MEQQRPLILVVDDEPDVRDIIRFYLEEGGYHVIEAPNAQTAIELAKTHAPNVITMDVIMPGMDGLKACGILKSHPSTQNIPILVLSIVPEHTLDPSKMTQYLRKPFEKNELLLNIKLLLANQIHSTTNGRAARCVLIVDDDPDTVSVVRYWLEEGGYSCLIAFDGLQAIDHARTGLPDLILLDLRMPGIDGFEVLEKLKNSPKTSQIPIVILTGVKVSHEEQTKVFQLGASEFITKPFEPSFLLKEIERLITKGAAG